MKQILKVAPIAIMICLVVPTITPGVASASPVDRQRGEVENIVDELERLEQQALDIGERYVEAIDDKARLDEEIVELEADIAVQEAELVELQSDLADMAVRSYMGAGTTPLGPLFENSEDINDVLQREELARLALSASDVTTDEIDAFVQGLEEDRSDLENKREDAQDLAESLVEAQAETDRLTEEYTQARADAEAELGQLLIEEEARRAAESLARVQAEVAAAQTQAPQQNGGANSGGGTPDNSGGTTGADVGGGNNAPATPSESPAEAPAPNESPASTEEPAPAPQAPPPSSRSGVAVNAALSQLDVPYKYATESPGVSFDCSGLTKYAWGQAGVSLPHQSAQQYASIPHVDPGSAQPGDLLFYYSPISHVGVYLGGGQLVHAPNTGSVVKVSSVNWGKVSGVGRPG